jgi:two-component system, cell cycle sensor histidine kinase and response regulator CckA
VDAAPSTEHRGKIVVDDLSGDAGGPLGSQGGPERHHPDPASQHLEDDALRVAATKYKVLFDSFPLGITISDETGAILESNKEAERLLGLGRDEQARRQIDGAEWRIIRPDGRLMPPDEYPSVRALHENRLVENVEMGVLKEAGDVTWISVTAAPLPLEGHGVVITYGDITARRKAERDYQTLFHEMLDGFALHEIICDADGRPVDYRFLAVNPSFERMTALLAQDIVGRTVLEVLPGTEPYWIDSYGKVALTGEPAFFESEHHELGKFFQVTAFRPAPMQFACIFAEITERRRAEAAHERLTRAVEQTGDMVMISDPQGLIEYVNPAFVETTGYSPEEALGRHPRSFLGDERSDIIDQEVTAALRQGHAWSGRMVNQTKDGTMLTIEATISPVKDALGRTVNYLSVSRDITATLKAAAETAKLQDQLLQAQKLESVGRLAGGVAHDFNNMLGVILGHTEMALERLGPGQPLYENLMEIHRAAERSADLTRQLLAFARKQTVAPRVLDLNATVEGMLQMLRRLIGEDKDLAWLPDVEPISVRMDPSQLDQILANLCVNARDAISDTGKITIETSHVSLDEDYCAGHLEAAPGEYVQLIVSDDGCGMDSETLAMLFEPFFTTKALGKGTGLGLATVYGVVTQNSGFINVYSEPGHGTSFKIHLPRHVEKTATLPDDAHAHPSAGGSETILLVEDEPAILTVATMMLEQLGYVVMPASTPGEAIRLATEHSGRIDLLMTDVVMPEMNGRDLAKNLLALYPDLRRLFMSGYTANVIAHRGVLDEGVHFIQKPFSAKALGVKVREALSEG